MRNLCEYISESLLDDEDDIMDSGAKKIVDKIFSQLDSFKLGRDGKTIVHDEHMNPYEDGYRHYPAIVQRPDSDPTMKSGESSRYRGYLSDELMDTIITAGFKFQPLETYEVSTSDKKFKKLPCDWVCDLDVNINDSSNFDLNGLNFDIRNGVEFTANIYQTTTPNIEISPYPKHLNTVIFKSYSTRNTATYRPEMVKGWDCDMLVIQCPEYQKFGNGLHDDMQNWDAEKIQQFVENNPKAKSIIFCENYRDANMWFKVKCAGSGKKRKAVSMTPIKAHTVRKKIYRYRDWIALDTHDYALKV